MTDEATAGSGPEARGRFFLFYLQICPEAHFPLFCILPLFLWEKGRNVNVITHF